MSRISHSLVSALLSATLVSAPLAAQAGGMSHIGTFTGNRGSSPTIGGPGCRQTGGGYPGSRPTSIDNSIHVYKPTTINNNVNVYKPTTIDNNITVYKPISIEKNVNVTTNIDNSKNININKPISITTNIDSSKNININKNIDNSKNIDITKNIDNSKYIDNSKNININKTIVINKGQSEAEALAIAAAAAAALANASSSASASATVNISGNSNSSSFSNSGSAVNFFGTSVAPEAPVAFVGGEIGNLSVEVSAPQPVCTYQEATIVKAIHAVCVSADGHEFAASHMTADTWVSNSYEGEVARCIAGSRLKVVVGKVTQSAEGMAAAYSSGQVLQCATHEAVRHYKDGALKCAPAVLVPDCTERTNLRKYGTGDLFFSYRAKVCVETHEEYVEQASMVGRQSREPVAPY